MSSRLDRLRQQMERLDMSAIAREALRGGYYVAPSGTSIAEDLATRLEHTPVPVSSHLIFGGPGSGKTTQLLLAAEQLNRIDDMQAVYIDVSERHDINDLYTDDIYLRVAEELLALGERVHGTLLGPDRHVLQTCRATLSQLNDPLIPDINRIYLDLLDSLRDTVSTLRGELGRLRPHIVVILDSLDHVDDLARFAEIITTTVPALLEHNLGVVFTAPFALQYSARNSLFDQATRVYHVSHVDLEAGNEALAQLMRVVRARIPVELCPDEPCRRLAELSGGVLGDVVTLARAAAVAAQAEGEGIIAMHHVEYAGQAFGRERLACLEGDEETLAALRKIHVSGTLDPAVESELALLLSQHVLEYRNGDSVRYRVHPAIAALL